MAGDGDLVVVAEMRYETERSRDETERDIER